MTLRIREVQKHTDPNPQHCWFYLVFEYFHIHGRYLSTVSNSNSWFVGQFGIQNNCCDVAGPGLFARALPSHHAQQSRRDSLGKTRVQHDWRQKRQVATSNNSFLVSIYCTCKLLRMLDITSLVFFSIFVTFREIYLHTSLKKFVMLCLNIACQLT